MNRWQAIFSTGELLQTFLNRFKIVAQTSPCAVHLGYKFVVRYVYYNAMLPFNVYEGAIPFREEAEAKQFHQQKIEVACDDVRFIQQKCFR